MSIKFASVEEQYKKFPQLDRNEALKLKEWYETQPHLPEITELEMIRFLHASDYSVEKAKFVMEAYYTTRTHRPEFFAKRGVFDAEMICRMNVSTFIILKETTKEGLGVVLWRLTDTDASKYNFTDSLKLFTMITDLWLAREGIVKGYAFILDTEGNTLSHLAKLRILVMKRFLYYIQEASPLHLKAIHVINTVPFIDKFLMMTRPFMKKELKENLHVHSSLDTFLDKYFPKSAMPLEYGGSAGKVKDLQAKVNEDLRKNAQFFIDEEATKRVNEKLRPEKPKTKSRFFWPF